MNKTAGFMGDSILYGYGVETDKRCWKVFQHLSGMPVIERDNENPMAFPGIDIFNLQKICKDLLLKYTPDIVFLSAGANNFDAEGSPAYPFGADLNRIVNAIMAIIGAIKSMNITPVWIGLPPFEAGGRKQKKALDVNNRISELCERMNVLCSAFILDMISDKSWDAMGGRFYDNLAVDIHPNGEGQAFIGAFCSRVAADFV